MRVPNIDLKLKSFTSEQCEINIPNLMELKIRSKYEQDNLQEKYDVTYNFVCLKFQINSKIARR